MKAFEVPIGRVQSPAQVAVGEKHLLKLPKSSQGINSSHDSSTPGLQYDQSPSYVSYFSHHMSILLRAERRADPGFSG
jgi:hypothetical protein